MGLTGQCTRHRRRSRFLFLVAGALYHVAKLMENKRALLGATAHDSLIITDERRKAREKESKNNF